MSFFERELRYENKTIKKNPIRTRCFCNAVQGDAYVWVRFPEAVGGQGWTWKECFSAKGFAHFFL